MDGKPCEDCQHNFEPRYDYGGVPRFSTTGIEADGIVKMIEASRSRFYLFDICTKCGTRAKKAGWICKLFG